MEKKRRDTSFAKAAHNQIQEAVFEYTSFYHILSIDQVRAAIYGADYMQLPARRPASNMRLYCL